MNTPEIKVNLSDIPDHVRDYLAEATLEAVKAFMKKPSGKEFLDSKIAQKGAKS